MPDDILVFAHIGDLHLTTEDQENFRDLEAIVAEITAMADGIDFVYLPGDNAENGLPAQYALAARALARLPVPVHIVTGDHDMEPGSLDAFYQSLDATRLPKALDAGGVHCLFLDICGPGAGGLDFRIGAAQFDWLGAELTRAAAYGKRCAIFMHAYPADLKGEGETAAVNAAFATREVLLVEMGHTHYNELANDGRTIFAAARSTGQIEEGPVGYALATIDGRTVSWRFKPLGDDAPVVLITAPADRRLAMDADDPDHVPPPGVCEVRACVLGPRRIVRCVCGVDDGPDVTMRAVGGGRYAALLDLPEGSHTIGVESEDDSGAVGFESIEIATHAHVAGERRADGSDADAVDAWEARGILGTQLGPNRNGRAW